jgi:hypothetical protein
MSDGSLNADGTFALVDPDLPPGVATNLSDGRFRATIEASSAIQHAGGRDAHLTVKQLDWREGESTPLASFDSAVISASRIDPAGNVFAIDEISLKGLETGASIDKDGKPRLLGLKTLDVAPTTAPAPKDDAATTMPTTKPASAEANNEEVARLVAQARRPLPLITLGKLDVNVKKLTLRDERRPEAAAVALNDLQVKNIEPISLGGPNADSQPPTKIQVTGAIDPLVSKFDTKLEAQPFANEPVANIDLTASGIRGAGLTDLLTELAKYLNGKEMTDGRFHATVQTRAKFNRRGPRDFDLARGFDLDLSVKDVAFRDRDGGPILAGVDSIQSEAIRIEPQNSRLHAKSIEISKPIALVTRETDGLHVLGYVVPLASASSTTQPAAQPTAQPAAQPAAAVIEPTPAPSTQPNAVAANSSGEVRIDKLIVTGAVVRLEDHAVDPPLIMPINAVDLEVRDVSTMSLHQDKPIRYSMVVSSDKVTLPSRPNGKTPATRPTEERELFSQVASSGSMSLYPVLHGYTKTSINGVEVAAFKGEAAALGVDLSGGIFDADITTRFRDEGSLDLRSKFVMTDLKLTEPANGPIQTKLALSAPLDVVIPAVQDADGGINIPLNVPIEKGKVSTGDIIGAGVGALSGILATAVASAPAKLTEGLTDSATEMIGVNKFLPFMKKKSTGPTTVNVVFAPGDASLSSEQQQQIDSLVTLLTKDKNAQATIRSELGGADLWIAGERANPSPADSTALAADLRETRAQLASQRARLAARATGELASSSASSSDTLQSLGELDRRIAQTDDAMDRLYEMLRPGADRYADRRTRAACIQIASQRLKSVRDVLMEANIPDASDRIRAVSATFNPAETDQGGTVVVTVVQRQRQKS